MKYEVLTMEEFDQYYKILEEHFPSKEVKEYHYLKGLFKQGLTSAITLKEKDKIIGILSYFDLQDFMFVDYFAILKEYQGQRLGQEMLNYFKQFADKPFILEVEHPTDEQSTRRINFYQRQGLCLNNLDYLVPKMENMSEELCFLLMSYPTLLDKNTYPSLYQRIMNEVYQLYKYQ